jgi:hypothetical protein
MRIHAQARSALWFGPGSGRQPIHRFDDPSGRFRVCYLGTTVEVCFAETFLRNPPVRILALDDLSGRSGQKMLWQSFGIIPWLKTLNS